ncbi:hypothetical protein MAR_021601 [Mya arenaria]|uniref:Ig-like domain-containing protein n=1 Tax=Mya arenaria TaxID=6604 RepID=A0ABY7E8A4_MYAAR|nr:hypothetical protein MAR_021601 [Mya arenaria]
MKRIMRTLTCCCFFILLKTYGCTEVVLSTDRTFVSENLTLTFTCSTTNDASYIGVHKHYHILVRMGYINNNCTIRRYDNLLSSCSCINNKTYKCTTQPMTRLNNTDEWYCIASVEGIAFKSNVVSIDVRVPIALVTLRPDLDKPMTVNEEETLLFTCNAFNGLPAANITWFMKIIQTILTAILLCQIIQ